VWSKECATYSYQRKGYNLVGRRWNKPPQQEADRKGGALQTLSDHFGSVKKMPLLAGCGAPGRHDTAAEVIADWRA
jgi:hypothetical protein